MNEAAHKELVKRLRVHFRSVNASGLPCMTSRNPDGEEAALALEALAGEVERLTTNGIHTCHDQCQRLPCVQGREIRALTAERDRLKAAITPFSNTYKRLVDAETLHGHPENRPWAIVVSWADVAGAYRALGDSS